MTGALTPYQLAQAEQDLASDPHASAFVSAHAGTGKTKLLIDRLLRLMLAGAEPGKILCLTFTKAAAAEMAMRLQTRLAHFITLPDDQLDQKLRELKVELTSANRARARALFAQVLDLPGGMRIGTIHAFCQSLLRQFPLEAGISPHFRLLEDAGARDALDQAKEAVLPGADPADLAGVAGLVSADGFGALTGELVTARDRLGRALGLARGTRRAAIAKLAGLRLAPVPVRQGWEASFTIPTEAQLIEQAVSWPGEHALLQAARLIRLHGTDAIQRKAAAIEGWLNLPPASRVESWLDWPCLFFTAKGEPASASRFCNPKLEARFPHLPSLFVAEQERLAAVLDRLGAARCAAASDALLELARPILDSVAEDKRRSGTLDYDDLIRATVGLLRDAGAAWVKFKLDADIDHILLDEVQDTSGVQWDVADALTGDFFAGEGARGALPRTVFAVGDVKQSIYSFQGAEPDEFGKRRARYTDAIAAAGGECRNQVLKVSFRSAEPVLRLVDAVFAQGDASCGVCGPEGVRHVAARARQAGSVTLWPLAPRPPGAELAPWAVPDENVVVSSAMGDLVRRVADWIADRLDGHTMLDSAGRPMRPGDMLVLVRRRGPFDRTLVRELKKRGVPVAGLDRMQLTEQLAVADLLSLCRVILLPEDDLALGEVLTSPLGGLDQDSLLALAAGRRDSLWTALRTRCGEQADWQSAYDFLAALMRRADFSSPYALLTEALGALGGRARLLARLGPEAAEPVDELLASAAAFARDHPPSLQGFLHWLERSAAEVKREADAGGDVVRIMTVHGAKGLEAPVVILPDTTGLAPDEARLHWGWDPETRANLFLWKPNKDFGCGGVTRLSEAAAGRRTEEYNRLLYVALTRARDHLLVCGWESGNRSGAPGGCWYEAVKAGLSAAGAPSKADMWGEKLVLETAQTAPPDGASGPLEAAVVPPPPWLGDAPEWRARAAPDEPPLPQPLAPSRPEGVIFGLGPSARSPLLRLNEDERPSQWGAGRGSIIHALLQHLPGLPEAGRHQAALAYARRLRAAEPERIAAEVMSVLENAALAPLFGGDSVAEQAVSGLAGGHVITGRIDRMTVLPDAVVIADYKTGRSAPASPEGVPVRYLRQMAAYRDVLRPIWPGRRVRCLLVWTEGPAVTELPDSLLDSHAPGSAPLDRVAW